MNARILPAVLLFLLGFPAALWACGPYAFATSQFRVELRDGTVLVAQPQMPQLPVQPLVGWNPIEVRWDRLEKLHQETISDPVTLHFTNGDRLRGRWASASLPLKYGGEWREVPWRNVLRVSRIHPKPPHFNHALNKPVSGRDGASYGRGLARHVTDGDPATHAKPPASTFEYMIDLRDGDGKGVAVREVFIDWGPFGDRFVGARREGSENWAPGAWPAEYVTSYRLEYQVFGSEVWKTMHSWVGRPVDERGPDITVHRKPAERAGVRSLTTTHLQGFNLEGVTKVRISSRGGHWIGLHELEVRGPR